MLKHIDEIGNLQLLVEDQEDRELVQALIDNPHLSSEHAQLHHLLDDAGFLGNGQLVGILPEQIGALTDSVILSDRADYDENGELIDTGNIWWYPNYALSSFMDKLAVNGQVTFTATARA